MTTIIRQDIELRRGVLDVLEGDPSIDARKIGVAVEDGIVALTGHVATYADKGNAETIAKSVAGVQGVANDIEVTTPKPEVNTAEVQEKIAAALHRSAELDAHNIEIEARDGRVLLSGTVRSWAERDDAVNAAWSARGVTTVVDQIRIHA